MKEIIEGKIYKLKPNSFVRIGGTSSLGGKLFETTEDMWMMCTNCYGIYGQSEKWLDGYFVEYSSIQCYEFPEVAITVSDANIEDGPFEKEDMIINPMLRLYKPMKKEERVKHLENNREYLAKFEGIELSDEAVENGLLTVGIKLNKI